MPEEQFDELNQARANRVGAWVVLFVGIAGAILGGWLTYTRVVNSNRPASDFKTLAQQDQDKINAMKSLDTDHDGLSDYDEVYVYHTSPYLADSDGDGISDKQELTNGTNPNCPEGQSCGPLSGGTMPLTSGTETATGAAPGNSDLLTSGTSTDADAAAVQAMLNPTPDQVRQLLISSGVKAADLANVDDATLLSLYHSSLTEAQAQSGTSALTTK